VATGLMLGACATSVPVHYFSLDDGQPTSVGSPIGLRVAITQVNLPEIVDRPQLVVRSDNHQLQLSSQYEWAEPLRQQIPRLVARDLSEALNSGRVVALAIDAQDVEVDFRVVLDVQRLEVVAGKWVDLDVLWRLYARDGRSFIGRSVVRQDIEPTGRPGDYQATVAAQRRAWRGVAKNVAEGIFSWFDKSADSRRSLDRNTFSALPAQREGRRYGT